MTDLSTIGVQDVGLRTAVRGILLQLICSAPKEVFQNFALHKVH
jgi:hypothetical protein